MKRKTVYTAILVLAALVVMGHSDKHYVGKQYTWGRPGDVDDKYGDHKKVYARVMHQYYENDQRTMVMIKKVNEENCLLYQCEVHKVKYGKEYCVKETYEAVNGKIRLLTTEKGFLDRDNVFHTD